MSSNGFVSSMKPKNSWSGSVSSTIGFPYKPSSRRTSYGGKSQRRRSPKIKRLSTYRMCRMKRLWFVRISLKFMDQICLLMDTTMRHRAGYKGLPIGLPRNWQMHRCRSLKVCMFKAMASNSGTSLMTIFLVTLM